MPRPPTTARRVTASLREPDVVNLEEVAQATKLTPNDAIRKALATEAWVQRELKKGAVIMIRTPDGAVREVAFVG